MVLCRQSCVRSVFRCAIPLAAALALGACDSDLGTPLSDGGTSSEGCTEGPPATVLQDSFSNFSSWTHYDLGNNPADGLGEFGDRVVYINKLPPHGSTAFPVGTLLVKTAGGYGTQDAGPTFAMAKVGGCYNPAGAKDWEWFELQPVSGPAPEIVWRGIQAPLGDTYNNQQPNSCNTCHASFSNNDYVPSQPLLLTNF